MLAGNAIILSNTAMQKAFNEQYNIGKSFDVTDTSQLKANILFYKNSQPLEQQRKYNYELAKSTLNWEKESKKLLSVID